ncbi:hypothetical protein HDU97_002788 [Phlyctochytrium planicorne]|nr:hypothetical protein HDU97_002788 [Phlyctochytrium planicorne]
MATTTTAPSTDLHKYNKYIIGAASLTAFSTMLYTIQQRTKGRMQIPINELLNNNPQARAANPKLAAYMFAGRAFVIGTGLMLTGTIALGMGVATVMQVNTLQEFSQKLTSYTRSRFPGLKGNYPADHDEVIDDAAYEFLKEFRDEARKEEREGPMQDNVTTKTVKEALTRRLAG